MNRKKERIVETFIVVMFPIALFVGCTSNGNEKGVPTQNSEHSYSENHTTLDSDDLTTLSFRENANETPETNAAHLQHAVYKPNNEARASEPKLLSVKQTILTNRYLPEKYVFNYESDQYNLDQLDVHFLKQHALFLTTAPELTLTISGHSDSQGPANYNKTLSEQRARLVYEILVTYGAPTQQLIVDSYGETTPLDLTENQLENRRVELEYSEQLMLSAR